MFTHNLCSQITSHTRPPNTLKLGLKRGIHFHLTRNGPTRECKTSAWIQKPKAAAGGGTLPLALSGRASREGVPLFMVYASTANQVYVRVDP